MSTIFVSGAIANKLWNGGAAWTRLNYVLGFRKLGFEVYFVEQIAQDTCVDDSGRPACFERSANVSYFRSITEQFGLTGRAALVYEDTQASDGLSYSELLDIAESADLLLNISGHLTIEPLKSRFRRKAYLDLDPGFTQFWHAAGSTGARLSGHNYYFTVGENIGADDCLIPTCDIQWRATRQPAVLDHWPTCEEGDPSRFTTVASWRGPYGPVTYGGRTFGSKVRQFRKYIDVPLQTNGTFEMALDIHPADDRDRQLLYQNAWQLADPKLVVPEPSAFRRYIQTSGAEFSVAQQIYVETQSGWFSDRSVRYLASGKPVLVEDTGFSRNYPVGSGLLTFASTEQAVAGIQTIMQDYSTHARAARQIAEEFFDSERVLSELIDQMGLCA
jgi:hypothetical protein